MITAGIYNRILPVTSLSVFQKLYVDTRHMHVHVCDKIDDSHITEDGATDTHLYKHFNTYPHTFTSQIIPKRSCSYFAHFCQD